MLSSGIAAAASAPPTAVLAISHMQAALVLAQCLDVCANFPGNAMPLLRDYRQHYDVLNQQAVLIRRGDGSIDEGIAQGIADNGELCVQINGVEQRLNSAEVSLRRTA